MVPSRSEHGYSLVELLAVVSVLAIVAGMALPMTASTLSAYRLPSDARAVAQDLAVTRMRAAARSTRTRLYVDLAAGRYFGQTWNKTTSDWDSDGSITLLSRGVTFSFGSLAAPPDNTQTAIGFSTACLDNANAAIANTACIVFNSRGIPIDSVGAPLGGNALYLTDGSLVYGTTLTATPRIRLWRSPATTASWREE